MSVECAPSWVDYWNRDEVWTHSQLWKTNAALFFKRSNRILGFKKDDSVLNIGCGPGYLEVLLAPHVQSIEAVDTSEELVRICQTNCAVYDNVRITRLRENYTDLSGLGLGKKFSLILCVSVVQYYQNKEQLGALIQSAREVALPGSRMLVADLPLQRNILGNIWDVFSSGWRSVCEGYGPALLEGGWALWTRGSAYRSFGRRVKTLSFSIPELQAMVRRLGLQAMLIRDSLSVYAHRPSLLIEF